MKRSDWISNEMPRPAGCTGVGLTAEEIDALARKVKEDAMKKKVVDFDWDYSNNYSSY